jgi:hypothetical protein
MWEQRFTQPGNIGQDKAENGKAGSRILKKVLKLNPGEQQIGRKENV